MVANGPRPRPHVPPSRAEVRFPTVPEIEEAPEAAKNAGISALPFRASSASQQTRPLDFRLRVILVDLAPRPDFGFGPENDQESGRLDGRKVPITALIQVNLAT